jgi:uncharacterized protein YgiM (DUF1202 family)
MMFYLKRIGIIILLLFVSACNQDEPEPTPTEENETPTVEVANTRPARTPSPTKPTTITPTLRATEPASETADSRVKPIANAINIRSGPGEGYSPIALLYEDETAEVLGTSQFGNWYQIRTEDGQEGWVGIDVVELLGNQVVVTASPTPRPRVTADPDTTRLRVTINLAYVRSGPGQNYPVTDFFSEGSTITVLAYASNGAWFNILLPDNSRGWIGATVTEPVGSWSLDEINAAATIPAPPPTPLSNCDPAYPTVCIPSPPPDLDCRDIAYRNFTALPPDPHLFDGNENGIGCETIAEP